MFTGIIQGLGLVKKIERDTKNRSSVRMTVDLGKMGNKLKTGQSVSLNGVCLTTTKIEKTNSIFEMIDETIKKTNLGNLKKGSKINVERSMKVGERLEGHFVLGHVDGTGIVNKIEENPKEVKFWFKIPQNLRKYIVKKGSIAVDGISLTVVDAKKNQFSVCLIPHTLKVTNMHEKKIGDKVNIETDILGKYILQEK